MSLRRAQSAIKPNESEIVFQCDNLGMQGEGVGRVDGKAVFVPQILPGEQAHIRITEERTTYARGECTRLLQRSPYRVEPFCPYYAHCGGCQLQHLEYSNQLLWKQQSIASLFERQAKLTARVLPVIPCTPNRAVRNKVQLPVRQNAQGHVVVGFFRPRSHDLTPITHCPMQSDLANRALALLQRALLQLDIRAYDEQSHSGWMRHVQLRSDRDDTQLLLTVVSREDTLAIRACLSKLSSMLLPALPELQGVVLNLNPQTGNAILGAQDVVIWGKNRFTERIGEMRFRVSGSSFVQTNRFLTETLYQTALKYAALTGHERVLEAYCGLGTISSFMAKHATDIVASEVNPAAINDARENAMLNGIANIRFLLGSSEQALPQLLALEAKPDMVLVDPPRQGCASELLQAVVSAQVSKLVYISCNPATLARDAAFLAACGYHVSELQPVDMFPWTEHVEVCCNFVLGK